MEQSLREYYQREMKILREDGVAFAARYPRVAPHLGLGPGQNPDPTVERLLESVAYLTARVREESEAELPALAGQILNMMCPSLAAPVPSISVVSFAPDYDLLEKQKEPWLIPAGTRLYSETSEEAPTVRWRTAWPLALGPARVTKVSRDFAALGKQAGTHSGECAALSLSFHGLRPGQTVRLFLKGDRFSTFPLHDWVLTGASRLFLTDFSKNSFTPLANDFLRAAGLGSDDLVLPGRGQTWAGFRLLQEYFACPERFLFWDIGPFPKTLASDEAELLILLKNPPPEALQVSAEMFDAAAVPAVNLFERPAEPVRLDHRRVSYRLHPDLRRPDSTEIHSVLSVTALAAGGGSFRVPHYFDKDQNDPGLAWQLRLSPSPKGVGTEAELFPLGGEAEGEVTLAARVLCTNRHWAARCGAVPLAAEVEIPARPTLVLPPSPQRDPLWPGDARWHLVSNFALAQESLGGPDGLAVLKNILTQYAPPDDAFSQRQIAGVAGLASEVFFHPLRPSAEQPLGGLVRGLSVDLKLDEDAFRGASPFVFASVMDVFMGLKSAINHLTRLRLFVSGHAETRHQWPPRCGERHLL